MNYLYRISNLQAVLPKTTAFFMYGQIDIYYLTGASFYRDAALLVMPQDVFLITDSRYRMELLSLQRICNTVEIEVNLLETIKSILPRNIKRVAVNGRVCLSLFDALCKGIGKEIMWSKELDDVLSSMRMVKDEEEIKVIKQGLRRHKLLFDKWKNEILGLSEKQAACLWDKILLQEGLTSSFSSIVAVGSSASYPHYLPSSRIRISNERPLLCDMGLCYQGYMTDLTRILFADRIERRCRFLFELVEEAKVLAFSMIRPGVLIKDVVERINRFFEKKSVRQYFLHGLGHGIGLEVHERPSLSMRSEDVFKEGMVFTVEPGLYVQPKVGVRLEDMVLVKKDGIVVLSKGIEV